MNGNFQRCSDRISSLCSGQSSKTLYAYVPVNAPGGATCPKTSPTTPRRTPPPTIKTTTVVPTGPPTVRCNNIEYKLTKLGCWNEREPAIALPELLLTAKDKNSKVYVGYEFHKTKYNEFIKRWVCKRNFS